MTKIKITTTQNIDIEYEIATLFDRVLAWLIDFLVMVGYILLASLAVLIVDPGASQFAYIGVSAPALLYHLFSETISNGRSIGKSAMGIRVVRLDGSPPNFFNYALRWVFRLVETSPVSLYGTPGVAAIAFNGKGQRIGDMLSGTTVIRVNRKAHFTDTIFMRTKPDYTPHFAEAAKLTDRDATTIRDVIGSYRSSADRKIVNACANRVAHVLHILPPDNMNADQFLRTVLRDYNHFS